MTKYILRTRKMGKKWDKIFPDEPWIHIPKGCKKVKFVCYMTAVFE